MNNQLRIKVIRRRNAEDMAKEVERVSNELNAFSSPIMQEAVTHQYVSFIYYRTLNNKDESKEELPINDYDNTKPKFKPTEEQLEVWKIIKPTYKTKNLLVKKGFTKEEINAIKTQYEAHIILEK